ncbi:MAG TPA: MFS transporter, partial [Acidimicrobiales bacterium]|nr:MFS transporter [Acidimicrobiales bacterium]
MTPDPGSHTPALRVGLVTAVVCTALGAVSAAMASLNVAIPDLVRATHASQTQLEWIIDAYLLVFSVLLLPAGALGDRYGRRRALVAGLVVFGAASGAAMTVTSAEALIVLRGLIGLGAALVMPATLSTITGTFPPAERTRAVGVWAAVAGGSAIVGLLCSGVLLQWFSWRAAFGVNVVLAAAALAGTVRFVPESSQPGAPRLDRAGALLATVGLVALVFSIIEAPDAGWTSTRTLVGAAAGVVALAAFVVVELHSEHPLLDPRLFADRNLAAGTVSICIQFFAFFGFTFVSLQYLQGVRGYSPLVAALAVLPLSATMMPVARSTSGLTARFGTRRVCVTGLLLVATGLALISRLGTGSSYLLVLLGLVPLGAGMGAAMTPATAAITEGLPREKQGVGSALNDLSREVGGALGTAVIGSIVTATYRSRLRLPGVPTRLAAGARSSFAVAVHAGGPVGAQARSAFVQGIHSGLLYAAGAAVVGAAGVVALLPRDRPVHSPEGAPRIAVLAALRS